MMAGAGAAEAAGQVKELATTGDVYDYIVAQKEKIKPDDRVKILGILVALGVSHSLNPEERFAIEIVETALNGMNPDVTPMGIFLALNQNEAPGAYDGPHAFSPVIAKIKNKQLLEALSGIFGLKGLTSDRLTALNKFHKQGYTGRHDVSTTEARRFPESPWITEDRKGLDAVSGCGPGCALV